MWSAAAEAALCVGGDVGSACASRSSRTMSAALLTRSALCTAVCSTMVKPAAGDSIAEAKRRGGGPPQKRGGAFIARFLQTYMQSKCAVSALCCASMRALCTQNWRATVCAGAYTCNDFSFWY